MGMTGVPEEVKPSFKSELCMKSLRDRTRSFKYNNGDVDRRFSSWFAWFPFLSLFEL